MPDNSSSAKNGHQSVEVEEKITSCDGNEGIQNLQPNTLKNQEILEKNLFKFQGGILSKLSTPPFPDQFTEKKQEDKQEEPKEKESEKLIVKESEKEKGQSKVREHEKNEQLKEKKEKEEPKQFTETTATPPTTYGYCGLINLGLSCYANSCLQVLFNLPPFRQYLMTHSEQGPFHKSLSELFSAMQAKSSSLEVPNQAFVSYKPDQFIGQFRAAKRDFATHRMADAHEFFTILLDLLHQEANKVGKKTRERPKAVEPKTSEEAWAYHEQYIDHSFWSSQLMGQVQSTLNCLTCGHKSLSWSCIWQLQLPLIAKKAVVQQQGKEQLIRLNSLETLDINKLTLSGKSTSPVITLSDCLNAYFAEEKLADDCAPFCEQCSQRRPATKSVTVCRAPKVLLVHLTRFLPDGSKNLEPVSIDEHIELTSSTSYKLLSAVLHYGSINYGHYVTLYNQQQPHHQPGDKQSEGEQHQQWIILDDDVVDKKLAKSAATEMLGKNAYLVIYHLDESQ